MKKKICAALILLMAVGLTGAVDISGRFNLFGSVYLSELPSSPSPLHLAGEFALKRIESHFRFASRIGDKLSWFLRLDLSASAGRLNSTGLFNESTPLATPSGTERVDIGIFEAYAKVSDFLVDNLDFTVGKQRISWGTADKIGIIDNLNPLDMAQFFTFSPEHFFERRPQNALNFEYYFRNREKLQLVLLLQKQIAPLPYGFNGLMQMINPGFDSVNVGYAWKGDRIATMNWAARFSTALLDMDWGVSIYRGNLQTAYPISISPQLREAHFIYPEVTVLGLDLAGELAGIGFWAEAGLFLPDSCDAQLQTLPQNDPGSQPLLYQGDLLRPAYAKWVLGADYHFGNGLYANLQYLHGFFDEAGYSDFSKQMFQVKKGFFFGDISDYLFFRIEKNLFSEKLKLKLSNIVDLMTGGAWTILPEM